MIKTVGQLKLQAEKLHLVFYPVHDCSMCNYHCGYIITGDDVQYDSGCNCVNYNDIQERNWEDLARTYNINQPENNLKISVKFLEELNEVWKF